MHQVPDYSSDRRILASADRAARRLCRLHPAPLLDQDDARQELLLDLLVRLKGFDPARSSLTTFVAICLRHRAARMALNIRRDRRHRHPVSLDEPLPGRDIVLHDTISEDEGYSAWIGQPTDRLGQVERRLDLDRALSALPANALPICATFLLGEPNPAPITGLSRTTLHRRKHELRCLLLASGVAGPVEQIAPSRGI